MIHQISADPPADPARRRTQGSSSSSSRSPMMSVTSSSVFLLLDERGIVDGLVIDLDVVVVRDRVGVGDLLALRLGVGVLERNEFGVLRLRHHRLFLDRRGGGARAAGSGRGRAVTAASSMTVWHFGQTIGSCSDRKISRCNCRKGAWCQARVLPRSGFLEAGLKLRCFTWPVEMPLSIGVVARLRPSVVTPRRPHGRRSPLFMRVP